MSGGSEPEIEETEYEKALASIALEKWQNYESTMKPFEEQWIADVTGDTQQLEDKVAGQINADVAQQYLTTSTSPGVDPSSGAFQSAKGRAAVANVAGKAASSATQEARDSQVEGLQAAIDIGRGTSTNAQLGMSELASSALNEEVSDAYSAWNTSSSFGAGIGTAIGGATALWNDASNKKSTTSTDEDED